MKEYKVDKGVPIPPPKVPSKWKDLFDSMKKNDSVYFETHTEAHGLCSAVWRMRGKGLTTMKPEGEGYRVWRLK